MSGGVFDNFVFFVFFFFASFGEELLVVVVVVVVVVVDDFVNVGEGGELVLTVGDDVDEFDMNFGGALDLFVVLDVKFPFGINLIGE